MERFTRIFGLVCFISLSFGPRVAMAVPPFLNSVSPSLARSGAEVVFTGKYFSAVTSIQIGGKAAAGFTVVSNTQIRVTLPDQNQLTVPTFVPITLANSAGESRTFSTYLKMLPYDPSVLFTSPSQNTVVQDETAGSFSVQGTCSENNRSVNVQLFTSSGTELNNYTSLATCSGSKWARYFNLLMLTSGDYYLVATHTNVEGRSKSVTLSFSRNNAVLKPEIYSITPTTASECGGTNVTINGLNFRSGLTVTVGKALCINPVVTPTSITCTLGERAPSTKLVVGVTNPNGKIGELINAFTYTKATGAYSGGCGSARAPYLISTTTDFQNINNNLSKQFRLTKSLDFTDFVFSPLSGPFEYNFTDPGTSFTGIFDGAGFTVSNLTIPVQPDGLFVGVFRTTKPGAVIKNLTVTNATVQGHIMSGILVGRNEGTIENCNVSGSFTVQDPPPENRPGSLAVGGIVGTNLGMMRNVSFTGTVDVGEGSNSVGGLAGSNGPGTISRGRAQVQILGPGYYSGGLAGLNSGHIELSYSAGSINGSGYVGGLVGLHNTYTTVSMENCYTTADVLAPNGAGAIGGLAKWGGEGSLKNVYSMGRALHGFTALIGDYNGPSWVLSGLYWNKETSQAPQACAWNQSYPVTGLTDAESKSQSSYVGFDFTNVWIMGPQGYPILR